MMLFIIFIVIFILCLFVQLLLLLIFYLPINLMSPISLNQYYQSLHFNRYYFYSFLYLTTLSCHNQITGPIHKESAMSMDLIASVLFEAGDVLMFDNYSPLFISFAFYRLLVILFFYILSSLYVVLSHFILLYIFRHIVRAACHQLSL